MAWKKVLINVAVYLLTITYVSCISVKLNSVGKIVRGSEVTFVANVIDYPEGEQLRFDFYDNAQPQHKDSFIISSNISKWTVQYQKDAYEAGNYKVTVELRRNYIDIWIVSSSDVVVFELTDTLNGQMVLNQNNIERPNNFVAVNNTVQHSIKLPDHELQYIKGNSSSILTYWFIDCQIVGPTTDLSLDHVYTDTMGSHHVEAILIANNDPLPPITTTTTSTTTSTTSTTTTTTTTPPPPPPSTTIKIAPSIPTTIVASTDSASIVTTAKSTVQPNITAVTESQPTTSPLNGSTNSTRSKRSVNDYTMCNNTVPMGKHITYGRYEMVVNVREPIATVNISGHNWLQHGDLLNLEVKYKGSPPFDYCTLYKVGQYNITGNETCPYKTTTVSNSFPLVHYFSDSDQHTVVVIIQNDLGKEVSKATINIYKTKVTSQLSVIVVPVVFSLVAVILVVFGIAYYQHRSRITIEVADFDFGQAHPDYKTFTERLRDSFRNAFNFGNHDDTDPLTINSRYDSMT